MKNTLLHLLFLLTTTKMMMVLKTESGVKDGQKLRRKFYMLLLSSRSWFWEEAEKVLAALVSNHFLDWDICCWRNEFNYFKTLNSKTLLFLWLINFPFEISLKLTLTLTCCKFSILSKRFLGSIAKREWFYKLHDTIQERLSIFRFYFMAYIFWK